MHSGKATIKEVARLAEVHPSTVSRALNAATRHLISPEIVAKVEAAAQELGYARNALASGLRTRRSLTVGMIVPDITNPLFPPMLRGVEDGLGPDYTTILANTDNDPERAATSARRLLARGVDGLILATARRRDPLIAELVAERVPLVLVNRSTDQGGVSAVLSDDAQGVRLMLDHLLALGHQRIAHLAGPQDLSTGAARHRAFKEAMRHARLEVDERQIALARSFTLAEGERLALQLLRASPRPTAILAGNDLLALGAYGAAASLGLAAPRDVSITGFNDMPFVDRLTPPLTTIRIQHYNMGVQAARLLLDRLARSDGPGATVQLGVELIVRGSTATALPESDHARVAQAPQRGSTLFAFIAL